MVSYQICRIRLMSAQRCLCRKIYIPWWSEMPVKHQINQMRIKFQICIEPVLPVSHGPDLPRDSSEEAAEITEMQTTQIYEFMLMDAAYESIVQVCDTQKNRDGPWTDSWPHGKLNVANQSTQQLRQSLCQTLYLRSVWTAWVVCSSASNLMLTKWTFKHQPQRVSEDAQTLWKGLQQYERDFKFSRLSSPIHVFLTLPLWSETQFGAAIHAWRW